MSFLHEYHLMWFVMACFALMLCYVLWKGIFFNVKTKLSVCFSFALVCSVVGTLVFGMYAKLGSHQTLKERYAFQSIEQTLVSLHEASQLTKDHVVSTFKTLEQTLPESENVWVRLADIYQTLNLYEQAAYAYEQALKHHSAFEPYEMQKIYCQVMMNEGKVDETTLSELRRMLQSVPDHKGALNLLALYAYQHENYSTALEYWQRILEKSENLAPSEKAAIVKAISKTENLLGIEQSTIPFKLVVELNMPSDLSSKLTQQETLFVMVKDLSGNPIPLAVSKHRIGKFPMTVELTDENVMIAGQSLSALKQFKLIARVSKSGQPLPQTGDLEGHLEILDFATITDRAYVEIDRQLNDSLRT